MCLAIPGLVVELSAEEDALARTALVDFGGVRRRVNLALVPEAGPGDWVVVHVGVAIARLDAAAADAWLAELRRLAP
ncbi:MAG: hypothetical protein KatS3mg124_1950 [Porticoccaceae bacterium]|nr:MAG: hypothetical protein KatS3mg124_1950 [Porticoccaceae bacterium]